MQSVTGLRMAAAAPKLWASLFGVDSTHMMNWQLGVINNDLSQRSSSNSQNCVTMRQDWRLKL